MAGLLYLKDMECPICSAEFSTPRVIGYKLTLKDRDDDFCPYYEEEQSFYYDPTICIKCGYGDLAEYFDNITDQQKIKVIKNISTHWTGWPFSERREIHDAIRCYKHLNKNAEAMEFKHARRGTIFLRLAWCYRHKENKKETQTLRKALEHYRKAYEQERLDDVNLDELTLVYLLGELNRRTGNKSRAVKWYSRVVSHTKINTKPQLEKMAREQWQMITKD